MQVRTEALREALELLKPVVPRKAALKSTTYVLLRDGEAVANNLDVAVILEMPGLEGECLVPHRAALETLKRVPGTELLDIRAEGKKLLISWSGGRSSFETVEVEEFPPTPEVRGETARFDGDKLIGAMAAVVPYCAKEDNRPVLKGVILSPCEEGMDVLGADGFRMAVANLPFSLRRRAVVPAEAVKALAHLWKRIPPAPTPANDIVRAVLNPREVEVVLGGSNIAFRFGRVELVAKLIPGEPPRYRELIPDDSGRQKVLFFAQDLERALRRLKGIGKFVRLRWENGTLRLAAKDEEREEEAELSVQAEGEGQIALSTDYLLDYLEGKEGVVVMSVEHDKLPALFRHGRSPLVLIMPASVEW